MLSPRPFVEGTIWTYAFASSIDIDVLQYPGAGRVKGRAVCEGSDASRLLLGSAARQGRQNALWAVTVLYPVLGLRPAEESEGIGGGRLQQRADRHRGPAELPHNARIGRQPRRQRRRQGQGQRPQVEDVIRLREVADDGVLTSRSSSRTKINISSSFRAALPTVSWCFLKA